MNKWKAVRLDPETRSVEEIEIEATWKSIAPTIGCDLFDVVRLEDDHDLFCDDEGLMKPFGPNVVVIKDYPNPIVGKVLILTHDAEGDTHSCKWTVEEVRKRVGFGTLIRSRDRIGVMGDFGILPIQD